MYNKYILLFLFFIPLRIFSQDSILTLQQAIEISLKNNYDIRIFTNIKKQQENNNSVGNSGMLPTIDANTSYTRSSNSLKQKYSNNLEVNRNASLSTNAVADLAATWTIFDGMKMFNTKEKLSELYMLSQDEMKIQIENTLQELITTYYSIVKQQQLLKSMREEILFSEERVTISDRKMNNGSGSRLEWLQTKTDFNRQRSIKIALESDIDEERMKLNLLMGRKIETPFAVEDTVIITYKPMIEDLKKSVLDQNNQLNYFKRNQRISKLELKEKQSLRFPLINLNAHYIYSKTTNEAGFTLLNQINGFNYGATATIPLFHGLNINRQIKNSKIDALNSDISFENMQSQVNSDLLNAWRTFKNNLELLQIEEQNIGYAREVLSVSQERYRIGMSSVIEQQDVQRTFEEAMKRLTEARFNTKISETILRKLNGELVK